MPFLFKNARICIHNKNNASFNDCNADCYHNRYKLNSKFSTPTMDKIWLVVAGYASVDKWLSPRHGHGNVHRDAQSVFHWHAICASHRVSWGVRRNHQKKKIPKSFPLAKQPPNFESTSYSSSTTIAITTTTTKYWTTLANFSTDCTINIRNPVHEASPTTQKENSNEQYTHVVDRLLATRIRLNPSCSDQNCASRATKRTTTLSPPLSAIYVFVGHFLLCIHTHQNCRNMFPKHANK